MFEVSFKLGNLLKSLQQVFRIQIAVRPDSLIQIQLLLQTSLLLDVLLLKSRDEVVLYFDLLQESVVLRVGLRCLNTILLLLFAQVANND